MVTGIRWLGQALLTIGDKMSTISLSLVIAPAISPSDKRFTVSKLPSEPIKHSRPDKQWVKVHPQSPSSPPGLPLWRARARLPWLSCYCCRHWDTFPPRCLRCHKVIMGGQGEASACLSLVTGSQHSPLIGQYPRPRNIRMSRSLYGTETRILCSNYCLMN